MLYTTSIRHREALHRKENKVDSAGPGIFHTFVEFYKKTGTFCSYWLANDFKFSYTLIMYWVLEVGSPDGASIALIGKQPDLKQYLSFFTWFDGTKITAKLPQPLDFYLSKSGGDFIPDFFDPEIPLMSHKMLDALADVGVDNIDRYKAKIYDTQNNLISEEYDAVNIIGKVACANLEESEYEADDPDDVFGLEFESLVIDESRAQGYKLFRLYESVDAIIVHDSVKNALEKANLAGIYFVKPEDWPG